MWKAYIIGDNMKKRIVLISLVLILIISMSSLISCDNSGYEDTDIYPNLGYTNIDTNKNSDSVINSDNVSNGTIVAPDNGSDGSDITIDSNTDIDNDTNNDVNTGIDTDSDIIVNPHYVTIAFNTDGGNIIDDVTVELGKNYILAVSEKDGYEFSGWYFNDQKIEQSGIWTISQESVELTAKWEIAKYKIQYDFNGGSKGNGNFPASYKMSDEAFQIGTPKREGNYKFIGWQSNDEIFYNYKVEKGTTGNISVKAIWYEYEYTHQDQKGYQYFLKDDNTLSVVGYVGIVSNLSIPSSYESYIVNEIGPYAFCGYGDKIANLSSSSFVRCDIPDSITKISTGAFLGCDDLKPQLAGQGSLTTSQWNEKLENWITNLEIEEKNDHVIDVIKGDRPAIGWKKYWKP